MQVRASYLKFFYTKNKNTINKGKTYVLALFSSVITAYFLMMPTLTLKSVPV